jgi:hypothetical protein
MNSYIFILYNPHQSVSIHSNPHQYHQKTKSIHISTLIHHIWTISPQCHFPIFQCQPAPLPPGSSWPWASCNGSTASWRTDAGRCARSCAVGCLGQRWEVDGFLMISLGRIQVQAGELNLLSISLGV